MSIWVFEQQSPATRREPNENQLFKTEQAGEDEYAGTDALVREILQNSMDAAAGSGPVRVRLALHAHGDLPDRERLRHYFSRLRPALKEREIGFDAYGIPQLQQGFLICEDFGTRGLGGDPLLARDPEVRSSVRREDFFWFWRNIGRSGKTGDDLGRWGLGKTVYRAASQVGCMLGLTVRQEDSREILMGQAVLRIHDYQGVEYAPEGYFCDGTDDSGLPFPIESPDELALFREEWKLSRKANEPGLSVVVPYIAPQLKGSNILRAICVHFFLPILREQLTLDLRAPDLPQIHLDQSTLRGWCDWLPWDGNKTSKRHVAPPIEFIKHCLAEPENVITTNLVGETKVPKALDDDDFEPADLKRLRQEFADEKLVGIRVRLGLPRKKGSPDEGELIAYLQRRPDGAQTDAYYTREGMTITKLNSPTGKRGIQSLVTVDNIRLGTGDSNPLASLLGDSEGPAHKDWDTSEEERPNRTWKAWKGRVKFCRKIVDHLVRVLAPPKNEPDFDLLSDFFSIEKTQSPQRSRKPSENGEGRPGFPGIVSTPRWYRLDSRYGGFRIVSNKGETVPENAKLTVAVAYDLPMGDPLKKWSPFDFDFRDETDIVLEGRNLSAKARDGNTVVLSIQGDRFSFTAEGFDELRDLFVRIDEEDAAEEQEEEQV